MRWILTREAADNAPLAAALRAEGAVVQELSCIARALLPWPALRADVVMVTSRTAAALVPVTSVVAALADSTAPALQERGIRPALTAVGGVVPLAQAVAERFAGKSVLYAHSAQAAGREEHTRALTIVRARCTLITHILYDIVLPPLARVQWPEMTDEPYAVFFASPSAVDNFITLFREHPALAPTRVACLGRSTFTQWEARKPAGFPPAFVVPTSAAAMVAKALL